jgi:hypothetical protein
VLRYIIRKDPMWKQVDKKTMLHWSVKSDKILKLLMKTPKVNITSAYPYIKSLAHKDVFGNMMDLGHLLAPDHFKFCPATFNFPNERELTRFYAY